MRKSTLVRERFRVGTSQSPQDVRSLAIRMAMEFERQREVGDRLRLLRGAKPKEALAHELGVSARQYHAWESGESGISWPNLQKLAAYYGVSENFLLYGDSRPEGARSQLDRIEAKLDAIVDLIAGLEPAVVGPTTRKQKTGT